MSGKLKEVRNRISSVKSTQQITKAMKVVAAAKLRRATDAIIQMRPYSSRLSSMLANIAGSESEMNIEFANERAEVNNVLVVAITSDRGLAGAFNSNVIKAARRVIEEKYPDLWKQGKITVLTIGKKGNDFFKKYENINHNSDHWNLLKSINFEDVSVAAEYVMNSFSDKTFDAVHVSYSRFKNAATQIIDHEQFLPIPPNQEEEESSTQVNFIYEPSKEQMIQLLVPKILKTQFYRYILDSNASEHGARMTAMDQASENANELLRDLKISYNRARQAAITTELTEIVSGAAALEAG